jgi:hypothetical protein
VVCNNAQDRDESRDYRVLDEVLALFVADHRKHEIRQHMLLSGARDAIAARRVKTRFARVRPFRPAPDVFSWQRGLDDFYWYVLPC